VPFICSAQADELHKRVVGQDEAVSAVADAVLRGRAGVWSPVVWLMPCRVHVNNVCALCFINFSIQVALCGTAL
jgi:hypothetical protein